MAYIGPIPAETFTSFATQEFSTSATTSYTLDHPVTNENELALFINNVRQQPGSGKAYTASGTALTLSAATASTDTMYAVFLGRALQTVNPAGGSVGSSQITAEMITGQTALAATPADTDELLISDAGVLKRIDFTHIKSSPGLVHISTTTVSSGVSSVDFTSGIDSTYASYKLVGSDLRCSNDGVEIKIRLGAGSFATGDYGRAALGREGSGSTTTGNAGNNADGIFLTNQNAGNASGESLSFECILANPSNTDAHKIVHGRVGYLGADNDICILMFTGHYDADTAAVTRMQVLPSAGTIDGGTFTLYGMAKS